MVSGGSLFAVNCTLADNEVRGGYTFGGGYGSISPHGEDGYGAGVAVSSGTMDMANCTISENRALGGAKPFGTVGRGLGGGLNSIAYYPSNGTVTVVNSILFGNFGSTIGGGGVIADDCYGPFSSIGHNIVGTASVVSNLLASDQLGVNPMTGPLQDNGGPTPSYALLATSPAIDAGAPGILTVDQRGQPRSVDNPAIPNRFGSDGTDIGAVEGNHVLRMTGVSREGTNVHVKFTSVSDRTYRLEWRDGLDASTASVFPMLVPGTGGIITFTNLGAGGLPLRFYRALRQ